MRFAYSLNECHQGSPELRVDIGVGEIEGIAAKSRSTVFLTLAIFSLFNSNAHIMNRKDDPNLLNFMANQR